MPQPKSELIAQVGVSPYPEGNFRFWIEARSDRSASIRSAGDVIYMSPEEWSEIKLAVDKAIGFASLPPKDTGGEE